MGHDDHDHDHDHAHDHEHDHAHDHDHAHEHSHEHAPGSVRTRAAWRDDLNEGAGAGKVLFLDAPSGLAGDMIIAALVDLGVPASVIADTASKLPIAGFHLHFGTRVRSGVVASSFEVHLDGKQPERTFGSIRAMLEDCRTLAPNVRDRALLAFTRLAKAEAKVHASSIEDVHFHEVGAVDAIIDIVGSAAALEYLGAEVVASPLPMGRGFVKARHGVLPLPAPAVVECLAGWPTYDAGVDFEFVTPTGAAIVAANAVRASRWPNMAPERVGWGAGTANLADRPNLLRAVLGLATLAEGVASDASDSSRRATHTVIEANIDDATGELVALALESLFEAGALDAWATPITMKKGRPAFTVSAIAPIHRADAVASTMLRETTSIGVRRHDVSRLERPRRVEMVETPYGVLPLKIAGGPYGPEQVKPELDPCAAAAKAHGVPVREVLRAALAAYKGH